MIKAALIGCGKISRGHVSAFETIDDAKIIAACDLVPENLNEVIEKTGAAGYTDYKQMIEEKKDELDLVIINLPHFLHSDATCFAAEHGVNVFLEKPMGLDSADCNRMIDCCKKCGVLFWVGHLQKYSPANAFAKELILSRKYGELVSFEETRNLFYFSDDRPRWFLKKELSGGGIMMNLGAHALDKLKFFTDSNISDISGKVHIREGFDCEDSGQAFVKMENGVTALLNFIGHTNASQNEVCLYLTKGEIRIRSHHVVEYCGEDGVFEKVSLPPVPPMTHQMQAVCRALRTGDYSERVSGEYGLDVIHAIKRLYGDEK